MYRNELVKQANERKIKQINDSHPKMIKNNTPKQDSSLKWLSRLIGFIWIFLTACFAILNIFVFVQPQWIGDTLSSPRAGHFGLYSYCVSTISDYDFDCRGLWMNFGSVLNAPFAVATFFVGFSAIVILLCLILFILFLCISPRLVYFICAFLQLISFISLLIALIVYPAGFDHPTIREVCGADTREYYLDTCHLRWAYILAIIACANALILSTLGFFLGTRQPAASTMHEVINPNQTMSRYGQLNEAFDERTLSEQTLPTNLSRR